jgi:hypothetical protein
MIVENTAKYGNILWTSVMAVGTGGLRLLSPPLSTALCFPPDATVKKNKQEQQPHANYGDYGNIHTLFYTASVLGSGTPIHLQEIEYDVAPLCPLPS